ncbi:hypothetical protein, partial [Salmonella enterica]|uniref:hypothetical protein n=1 Tax=Salmonella enterica TaxID=28901 RepID=UPI00398C8246
MARGGGEEENSKSPEKRICRRKEGEGGVANREGTGNRYEEAETGQPGIDPLIKGKENCGRITDRQ